MIVALQAVRLGKVSWRGRRGLRTCRGFKVNGLDEGRGAVAERRGLVRGCRGGPILLRCVESCDVGVELTDVV